MTSDRERKRTIRRHTDLEVYQRSFAAAMKIFQATKSLPPSERYSHTSQGRRSSRSVCANLAEAWRKRRYSAAFVAKLSDAEGEAAETQVWLQFAVACEYFQRDVAAELYAEYDDILGMLVAMIRRPEQWSLRR
ncbi:MAG: four helix bundle protein [Planctomycetales bacterium]|nr:four helix bundle protein [Planctomycetales bacterium]